MSSHAATPDRAAALAYRPLALPRVGVDAALTAGIAAVLAAVAFAAEGGLLLGRTTKVELVLLAGSGLTVAAYTSEPWAAGGFAALATVGASPRRV